MQKGPRFNCNLRSKMPTIGYRYSLGKEGAALFDRHTRSFATGIPADLIGAVNVL